MRPLTEQDVREAFTNATEEELRLMALPHDFVLIDWDHIDFLAWRDPHTRGRGYLVVEFDDRPSAVILRMVEGRSMVRSAMCNLCHTMQPADQVSLFTARRAGSAGEHGDSVGTYICADLSCHETVRLAMPLAPNEVRGSVDRRIDGTRLRTEAFVERVVESVRSSA